MILRGWKELGSGSDAALLIWAPALDELLVTGAHAVISFALDIENLGRRIYEGPEVELDAPDAIELFLIWLNEVNYRLQVNKWISWSPRFSRLGTRSVSCRLDGFPVNAKFDLYQHEIKAVTRHRPFLNRGADGTWVARVTLDL